MKGTTVFTPGRRKPEDRRTWALFLALGRCPALARTFVADFIGLDPGSAEIKLQVWPSGYGEKEPDGELRIGDLLVIYEAKLPGSRLQAWQIDQYLARVNAGGRDVLVLAHTDLDEPAPEWEAVCSKRHALVKAMSHKRLQAWLATQADQHEDAVARFLAEELRHHLNHTRGRPLARRIDPKDLPVYVASAAVVHRVDAVVAERLGRLAEQAWEQDIAVEEPEQSAGRWVLSNDLGGTAGLLSGLSFDLSLEGDTVVAQWVQLHQPPIFTPGPDVGTA